MNSLIINRSTVSTLLTMDECIIAVEEAFRLWALGKASPPGILGVHGDDGGFHTKAGILDLKRSYFVAKTNANFPKNRTLYGLPTIQGVISISDASNGTLLALMDSIEITIIRTGAATAVAAKYLSKKDSATLCIIGCGNQGLISVKAIREVRHIKKVFMYDIDPIIAGRLADVVRKELDVETVAVNSLTGITQKSDIIVTCTPSTQPLLFRTDISPGTFVAAVGADSDTKHELDPELFIGNKVIVDSLDQCAHIGDLHHALNSGLITREAVHASLGQIVAGMKNGRSSDNEVIIFDSTGTGLQDVAAAAIVYERAAEKRLGLSLDLAS